MTMKGFVLADIYPNTLSVDTTKSLFAKWCCNVNATKLQPDEMIFADNIFMSHASQ